MSKEPWNEEIYHSPENSRKTRKNKPTISTRIFTILTVIFLIIVLIITVIALFLSNGGSTTNSSQEFHNTGTTSTVASSTEASSAVSSSSAASTTSTSTTTSSSSTTTTSSTLTDTGDGKTITVLEGEGAGSIAARAGITVDELYALNPDKMVGPGNTWWANPGDVVKIK